VSSHIAHLTVTITNLDGAAGETEDITDIIESALRSAGYKADATVDHYGAYGEKP
jgi:hypothetical protein